MSQTVKGNTVNINRKRIRHPLFGKGHKTMALVYAYYLSLCLLPFFSPGVISLLKGIQS